MPEFPNARNHAFATATEYDVIGMLTEWSGGDDPT